VQSEKRRAVSERSRVEKEAGSSEERKQEVQAVKRSSPVKQPSKKTQADSGHQRREMD
jgi:hypothetical protein